MTAPAAAPTKPATALQAVDQRQAVRLRDRLPIVLSGGPADGHWYWPDDFNSRRLAARRRVAVHDRHRLDPASWPLLYAPTGRLTHHRRHPEQCAVVWAWTGPSQVRTVPDLAALAAVAAGHATRVGTTMRAAVA